MIQMISSIILFSIAFSANAYRFLQTKRYSRSSVVYSTAPDISIPYIASKWKLIQYGQGSDSYFRLNCVDRNYIEERMKFKVSQNGGIGICLLEVDQGKMNSGLVVIDEIFSGSNAEKAGGFKVGDTLVSISSIGDSPTTSQLEALNFNAIVKELKKFAEFDDVILTVKRPVKRKDILVKMVGPDGEDAGSFTVLAGYGVNMRTALQAENMKMYDESTARFDSPYESGNCGGEGTCGTCMVAVLEGRELLNIKERVEEKVLLKQQKPANYRWSCRVQIAPGANVGGTVKIKLRPQATTR